MVTEIAIIDVKPDEEAAFESAYRDTGHDLLATTPGCVSATMHLRPCLAGAPLVEHFDDIMHC